MSPEVDKILNSWSLTSSSGGDQASEGNLRNVVRMISIKNRVIYAYNFHHFDWSVLL
jgi:hypothetical protein